MRLLTIIFSLLISVSAIAQDGAVQGATEQAAPQATAAEPTATEPTTTDAKALWDMANTAYNEGNFEKAAATYEQILSQNLHSAALYYNLANAYFKQNKLGKALLNYNRASRIAPGDEDIRHNQEYAEKMTKDSIEKIPEFFLTTWLRSVRGAMSCTAWTLLSIAMLAVALVMALVYLLAQRMSLRKVGFYTMAVAVVLFVATSVFAISERNQLVGHTEAIVMSTAASVKSSPDRSATELFVLHEGTKVSIGATTDGWAEVRIADGRKGWIEDKRIERI
ncbi:MAG: tetratricopeptide repeat protein [Alistipes sp.]|nr:tetratricopeptide repeat protein [Alistipes sp.]